MLTSYLTMEKNNQLTDLNHTKNLPPLALVDVTMLGKKHRHSDWTGISGAISISHNNRYENLLS